MSSAALHFSLLGLAILGYIALTVTGHDGNPIFVFIAGQGATVGINAVAKETPNGSVNGIVVAPDRSTIK